MCIHVCIYVCSCVCTYDVCVMCTCTYAHMHAYVCMYFVLRFIELIPEGQVYSLYRVVTSKIQSWQCLFISPLVFMLGSCAPRTCKWFSCTFHLVLVLALPICSLEEAGKDEEDYNKASSIATAEPGEPISDLGLRHSRGKQSSLNSVNETPIKQTLSWRRENQILWDELNYSSNLQWFFQKNDKNSQFWSNQGGQHTQERTGLL